MILPARVVCHLGGLSRSRVVRLLQDGLGLSLEETENRKNKEQSRFGSIAEDMVARIVSSTSSSSSPPGGAVTHPAGGVQREEEMGGNDWSWEVHFHAPTENLATGMARKAALLSRRFH